MEWQPIETAPQDGAWLLVCQERNGIIRTARYNDTWKQWTTGASVMSVINEVSHWMPLPEPPK